jgi:hypothetical protein
VALIDDLLAYYKFDEASGNAIDDHGSADFTDNNTVGAASGLLNGARDLESGSSEYFELTSAISALPVTVSVWFMLESLGATKVLFAFGSSTSSFNVAILQVSAADQLQLYVEQFGVSTVNISGSTALSSGVWYHAAAVIASGDFRLYLDGSLENSSSTACTPASQDRTYWGLRYYGGSAGDYFDGLLDEGAVFDAALAAGDVTTLYNGGAPLAYPLSAGAVTPLRTLLGVGV